MGRSIPRIFALFSFLLLFVFDGSSPRLCLSSSYGLSVFSPNHPCGLGGTDAQRKRGSQITVEEFEKKQVEKEMKTF